VARFYVFCGRSARFSIRSAISRHRGRETLSWVANTAGMKVNMLLAALFLAVGIVLVVVGGWFGLMVGIVALLMGLVLLLRGYRLRSASA
jgi:hypothetical protein